MHARVVLGVEVSSVQECPRRERGKPFIVLTELVRKLYMQNVYLTCFLDLDSMPLASCLEVLAVVSIGLRISMVSGATVAPGRCSELLLSDLRPFRSSLWPFVRPG